MKNHGSSPAETHARCQTDEALPEDFQFSPPYFYTGLFEEERRRARLAAFLGMIAVECGSDISLIQLPCCPEAKIRKQ